MKKKKIALFATAGLLVAGIIFAAEQNYQPSYTAGGGITLPDYRRWVFVGAGLGMQYTDHASENPSFTSVFVEGQSYESYLKNGIWPDKTVLVLEVRPSATNLSISKNGYAQAGDPVAIELEVKDKSKGGWLFYTVPRGTTIGTVFAKTMPCYTCHAEHAAVDNTFVQFYPTLIDAARRHGTYKER